MEEFEEQSSKNNENLKKILSTLQVKEKKLVIYKWIVAVSMVLIAISLFFNISFCFKGIVVKKNNTVSLASDINSKITDNLVVGETYVNNFIFKYKSLNIWGCPCKIKIEIKNANIIKENGFFSNICFESFSYDDKTQKIIGETYIHFDTYKTIEKQLSFNFTPTNVGDVIIKIFINNSISAQFKAYSDIL